jgi:hypothetical protein
VQQSPRGAAPLQRGNGDLMETAKPMLVIGSVKNRDHLQRLMEALKKGGFAQQDLSIIAPGDEQKDDPRINLDHKPGNDPADEKPRSGSSKLSGVVRGALFGGLGLGLVAGLIGLASLAIPGLHLFAGTGRMATVLIFAGVGAAAGVIAGGLIGLRAPEHLTKQHEVGKRAGKTLITVHAETNAASERAMAILQREGAEEVHQKAD